jgi:hypothetical protein
MKTINRTVVTISPRQPYINWANSFEDDGPKLESGEIYSVALLIPDRYDETNFEEFIKKNYSMIFEEELAAWMADPDAWPKNRTYKKFKEWFEVNVSDTVIDYGIDPIIIEEL